MKGRTLGFRRTHVLSAERDAVAVHVGDLRCSSLVARSLPEGAPRLLGAALGLRTLLLRKHLTLRVVIILFKRRRQQRSAREPP